MTLITQKASFGVSRDENPDKNDTTLAVLSDSGSNINIIQQKDTKLWGIPETYQNKPGRLNGIGTLPTLGIIGLAIPLQGEKMINGIMKPHVHVYTCEALIINDDTGPKCTLLSSVQFEQMGYKWESSRALCTLTAPDETRIPLTRNRYNGFWYFNALKIHHDADLTRKEIARQFRHYKTTSLYLPLTLMAKYKKSNINSQPIIVKLPTARTNLKALPQSIEITLRRIHSILAHTNLGTIKKLADGNHIIGLEVLRTIPDPQIPQCETCALSKMKTPTIPQKKMETLKHRTWTGMSIDTIGPFDKSVEGHHYGLVARHTQDLDDEGETTNGSNFLIILGMTTKAEAPNAVLTLINLLGAPRRIHSDNAAEYGSEAMQQIYKMHNIIHTTTTPYTPYANGKVENGIGLIKTLTRTMLISSGLTKNHWYMAARYATYIANKISMCPSKKHTVWQEYYKEKPNILTDYPFGALSFILLTHEQQLAQKIDHSFGPRSLTGIYLGKDTIHGKEKHIIVTSTQNGTTHYTTTFDRLRVCVDIIPLRPKFEISTSEVQTALLTMTEETLEYSDLDSLTFAASARIAKHQAKQHQPKRDTVQKTPQDTQSKPKLKKGYYEVEKILDHRGMKNKKEYLVRWKGYDSEEDSWIKEKDVTQSAIAEYRQYLKNKDTPHSQLHNTHIRTIPNDLINGDNYDDPLKIIQVPKQRQITKTGIAMQPLPEDWITRTPYKNATYEEIVPRYTYKPPTKTDPYVGRKVKTYYMCFTTLETKTEIGEIISYNDQNKDWQVKYQDETVIDIDADTLEHSLLDHNNESMNDNIQKIMGKAVHEAAYLSNLKQQDIPKGMRQVQNHPEKDLIMKAIDLELQAFKDLDVYDTVSRKTIPRGAEIIYSHIVFDKKYKIDPETKRNVFLKWKARLVFDGSKQKAYEDTFSPTPSLPMIRTLLAECCTPDWEVRHKDLGNAFCATPLEGRSLYVKPPSGLPGTTEDTIWVIKKTVYGLKDSNRAFYNLLKKTILSFTSTEKIKFEVGTADQCLFIARDKTGKAVTYIVGYVDDLIVADRSNQNHVSTQIMECIQKYWKVSDEGTLTRYLGVHFTRDVNGGWTVDNSPYITQAKEKFDQYPLPTSPQIPMPTDWHVTPSDWDDYTLDVKLLKHYQSIIGVLIWTVSTLRFDVAYHISVLAQYMTRPTEKLVKSAYRVMGYLVGTPNCKICYNTPAYPELRNRIYAACDTSFADDRLTRKSQQGHLIFYNSGPIIWKSNRQRTIALSTTEAELDSFVSCVRSVLHTMRILDSMGSPQHGVNIFEDNRSTIAICTNNMSPGNSRTKHVDLKIKWLQDHLQKGDIKIHHVPTSLNMADILTKALPRETFVRCIANALNPDDILPPIAQNEGEC